MTDTKAILESAKTIAVVGCSPRPERDSHSVARYLQESGYKIIPVNPNIDSALGEHSYPSLMEIPEDTKIDIVNIFRRPEATADMVRDAAERAETSGQRPVIWVQLGVHSDEAEAVAEEAGLPYIKNHCIRVAHQLQLT